MNSVDVLTEETTPSMREAAWCRSAPHADFVIAVLGSADGDNIVRASAGNLSAMSMMIGMMMVGWLERVNHGYHTPLAPYRITESGRNVLARAATAESGPKP